MMNTLIVCTSRWPSSQPPRSCHYAVRRPGRQKYQGCDMDLAIQIAFLDDLMTGDRDAAVAAMVQVTRDTVEASRQLLADGVRGQAYEIFVDAAPVPHEVREGTTPWPTRAPS